MKKIVCLLLVCFTLITCFAGCGKKSGNEKKNNNSKNGVENSVLPEKDWGGKELKVFINQNELVGNIIVNEDTTDLVGYEVFSRNAYIENKYNFDIFCTEMTNAECPAQKVRNDAAAGESTYDLILDSITDMKGALAEFLFADLADLDYIDWEAKGWLQEANDGLDILGYRYICTGDANLYEKSGAVLMYYNSDIMYAITEEGEDIRQIALDGNWTMEKMCDLIKRASIIDSTTNEVSVYGLANPHNEMFYCYLATGYGMQIIQKDLDGNLFFSFDDPGVLQQTLISIDEVLKFFCDNSTTYNQKFKVVPKEKKAETLFLANRVLFQPDQLCSMKTWKGANINYGFLPLPKANEDIDKYHAAYYGEDTQFFAIPAFAKDLSFSAFALQAMMENSGGLTHAYVEEQCKIRGSADDVDYQLISLALDNFLYDLGAIFDWGAIKTWIFVDRYDANADLQSIPSSGVNNLVTNWESKKGLAHSELYAFLNHFQ